MPHEVLKTVWRDVTGDSYIVDVRQLKTVQGAVKYVTKYVSKAVKPVIWRTPELYAEVMSVLFGRKTFYAFGTFNKLTLCRPPGDELNWGVVGTLQSVIYRANNDDENALLILRSLRGEFIDEPVDSLFPP
jgi:hypothetical protein